MNAVSARAKLANSAAAPEPTIAIRHTAKLNPAGGDPGMRQWLFPRVLVAACLALGVDADRATYHVFNQTWDEPAHVAAGMQWLDRGRYTYEPLHPPLARVMVALGPRLAGSARPASANVWLEGNAILYAGGRY